MRNALCGEFDGGALCGEFYGESRVRPDPDARSGTLRRGQLVRAGRLALPYSGYGASPGAAMAHFVAAGAFSWANHCASNANWCKQRHPAHKRRHGPPAVARALRASELTGPGGASGVNIFLRHLPVSGEGRGGGRLCHADAGASSGRARTHIGGPMTTRPQRHRQPATGLSTAIELNTESAIFLS